MCGIKMKLCSMPSSLLARVLQFIADNALSIESLVGFPSLVGKNIFNQMIETDKLANNLSVYDYATVLRKFGTAYGDELLPTVNLSNGLLLINEYLEPLLELVDNVIELDLNNCDLGPCHELLTKLSRAKRLKKLNLRRNDLSDDFIQNFTRPVRKFDAGSQELEFLDLSGNRRLTDKSVIWLCGYKKLQSVNLSGTKITEKGVEKLCEDLNMTISHDREPFEIQTSGWAMEVIEGWRKSVEAKRKKKMRKPGPYNRTCRGHRTFIPARENAPDMAACEKPLILKKSLVSKDVASLPSKRQRTHLSLELYKKEIERDVFLQYCGPQVRANA